MDIQLYDWTHDTWFTVGRYDVASAIAWSDQPHVGYFNATVIDLMLAGF